MILATCYHHNWISYTGETEPLCIKKAPRFLDTKSNYDIENFSKITIQ